MERNPSHDDVFHPRDAVGTALRAGVLGAGGGFFLSAVMNALSKKNVGAMGVFTRTGGAILTLGMSFF
jgi:hypothetical protein